MPWAPRTCCTAASSFFAATAVSKTPVSRMPRMPPLCMASTSAADVFSSMTATPRARSGPSCLIAVERCGIVGAVNARRHDHDMIHVQRFLQREQIVGGGDWRRISAARPERKLLRIGEDMRVRIDGAARHVEIDRRLYRRRRRLRSCVAPPRLAAATAPAMRKASLRVSMISSELACFVEHGLREANRSPCRRLAPSLRGRSYFSTKAFSMTKSPGSP